MSNSFFDQPILNSPYDSPGRHWELDASGQPTQHIVKNRRPAEFITPIPKPKKQKTHRRNKISSSMKEKGFLPRNSSMIPLPSSTKSANM
ncbi:hypothetical protein [Nitrosomonas communis]|uniref:hypothetical protein n=1 Tax=Nitrosomonas communis TaxID=44574 RepID=UPI003D27256E